MCPVNTCYWSLHTLGNLMNQASVFRMREAVWWSGRYRALESIGWCCVHLLEAHSSHFKKKKCVTYFSGCSEDWSMNSFIYLIIYSFTYYALCTYYLPDFVLDSKDRKRQNACPQSLWPCTYREKWTVLKTGCLFLICKSPFWVHGVSARRNMIRLIFPKGHLAAVFRLRDRPARVTLMRSVWRKLQESRCKIKWLGLRWQQQRWQEGDQNKGEKPVREAQREHMWNA